MIRSISLARVSRGRALGAAVAMTWMAVSVLCAAPSARAADAVPPPVQKILASQSCAGCHAKSQTLVGPSFDAIAQKYHGRADAPQYLMQKVRTGGSGVWGEIPMPPHPGMAQADLQQVVQWILAQKP